MNSAPHMMIKALKKSAFRLLERRRISQVSRILKDPTPPNTSYAEKDFEKLQNRYPNNRGDLYSYDDVSLFERASLRAMELLNLPEMGEPGMQILDLGAGWSEQAE